MNERKLGRKVTIEIYENNIHTQTRVSGLYKTDLEGNPTVDIFKKCKALNEIRGILLSSIGRQYLDSAFLEDDEGYNPEFVLVKINKRGLSQKQYISKQEYDNFK